MIRLGICSSREKQRAGISLTTKIKDAPILDQAGSLSVILITSKFSRRVNQLVINRGYIQ